MEVFNDVEPQDIFDTGKYTEKNKLSCEVCNEKFSNKVIDVKNSKLTKNHCYNPLKLTKLF